LGHIPPSLWETPEAQVAVRGKNENRNRDKPIIEAASIMCCGVSGWATIMMEEPSLLVLPL